MRAKYSVDIVNIYYNNIYNNIFHIYYINIIYLNPALISLSAFLLISSNWWSYYWNISSQAVSFPLGGQ